ncbi:MAG: UDP-3-O-(3-hydroxymyristoyl)glucosamine N-acyltransferase, partial [Myxococcales bacterium]|nr:UDP-3-O-(3-hydroxymyristoyl)glucosamine N-acyltransferase [Myxococcales bacterium]
LAALLDASPLNVGFECEVVGFGTLETATSGDLSFFGDRRYVDAATRSHALLITTSELARLLDVRPLLIVERTDLAVFRLLSSYRGLLESADEPRGAATVDPSASLGTSVRLGASAYVGARARIGDRVVLGPGAVIERDVEIGADSVIGANVVIGARCQLGERVIVQPGTVIGSDGFGYLSEGTTHHKIPHFGIVVVEDEVEIGANCCVDRATLGETRIGRGTKIDNLVQIAHNVQIGDHSLLAAQTGISGSTRLGRFNVAGGQSGFAGHLELDDGVIVGARAGVSKNLKRGIYAGFPIAPLPRFRLQTALIAMLPKLHQRIRALERGLAKESE